MPGRVDILGIPVDAVGRSQVVLLCGAWMRGEWLRHVVTANPELVLAARADAGLRSVVSSADLVVPDGTGLLWAARRYGRLLPERVAGVDLVSDLSAAAARAGVSAFLLGGAAGRAGRVADRLRREVRGLKIEAFALDHRADEDPKSLWETLERVRPVLLFVAYGPRKQELWIAAHKIRLESIGVRVALGVGGAFDILAGRLPRAPRILRDHGLEWLWRVFLEPARLPRIVRATFLFPLRVLLHRDSVP